MTSRSCWRTATGERQLWSTLLNSCDVRATRTGRALAGHTIPLLLIMSMMLAMSGVPHASCCLVAWCGVQAEEGEFVEQQLLANGDR
jgi:hypothetical protein